MGHHCCQTGYIPVTLQTWPLAYSAWWPLTYIHHRTGSRWAVFRPWPRPESRRLVPELSPRWRRSRETWGSAQIPGRRSSVQRKCRWFVLGWIQISSVRWRSPWPNNRQFFLNHPNKLMEKDLLPSRYTCLENCEWPYVGLNSPV